MKNYHELLEKILNEGEIRNDRTGTGTISLFSEDLKFNLKEGFPLITTKKVPFRLVAVELEFFIKGITNNNWLVERNCHIWDEWAKPDGDLGPIYGKQWRNWQGPNGEVIDQLVQVIEQIKNNPDSRRLIVSAWNPGELKNMALPPCHSFFQFYVSKKGLSCKLTQRSGDAFLGIVFNIASYALLTHLIAKECHLEVDTLTLSLGDVHIYSNHVEQVKEQLTRTPRVLPQLIIKDSFNSTLDFDSSKDFELIGYDPYPAIKAPVAV